MKLYEASIFKGHHIIKSNLNDGSPYKQRTYLMLVKKSREVVVTTTRLIKSKEKPDDWCSYVRNYKGDNYWLHISGIRLEKYIEVDKFITNKIIELTDKITEINEQNI